MHPIKFILFIFAQVILFFPSGNLHAWSISTHKLLSEKAVMKSGLNPDLIHRTGLNDTDVTITGTDSNGRVKSQTIVKWIMDGSDFEDDGDLFTGRFYNHFYNPLKNGTEAGLDDEIGGYRVTGEPALSWGLESANNPDWSWQAVRGYYYRALTAPSPSERQSSFARLFDGLGHQFHLIQDMAQPAHVRNDAHPLDGLNWWVAGLESWAARKKDLVERLADAPVFPILPPAPLFSPAIFWDADRYDGTAATLPSTLDMGSGLAEYTNANFFSDDTITSPEARHQFPFPSRDPGDYHRCDDLAPSTLPGARRVYLSRLPCQPGSIDHFLTLSLLEAPDFLWFFPQHAQLVLDSRVHEDYARHLIPRAVGYSAALLDYFFRGKILFEVDDEDTVHALAEGRITNRSAEEMDGTFELFHESTGGSRELLGRWNLRLPPGGTGPVLRFPLPSDNAGGRRYVVAFRGKMGGEENGTAGYVGLGGWSEEWDEGLYGRHPWIYSETDLAGQNPNNGMTINQTDGGKLVKKNIRYAGSDGARVNETYIGAADEVIDGTFYLGGYAVPYDFTGPFPLRVFPETRLSLKIDAMEINEPVPMQSCDGVVWPAGAYQGISLEFVLGDQSIRRVVFTAFGHESRLWPTVFIPLGEDYTIPVYPLLESLGEIQEPVHLNSIHILQQMVNLCAPSQVEHRQEMEIDHIRLER
jgi:hypothetical protein